MRAEDAAAYAVYRRDFLDNDADNPYSAGIRRQLDADDTVDEAIMRALSNLQPTAEWRVPQVDYYLFLDAATIAGRVSCRLAMTPELAETGGHIGYGVAPSQRRHGYAQQLLQYALNLYRRRGEPFVILTAAAGNKASRHVIEANGGVLQRQVPGKGDEPLCIYHIALTHA
ncbi:GNAT family N-acetyltransferase [Lacticaseibacillus zhaodongensis]|uniref:GNAT family N-acetyltransferase n=1 Tax=Lacticaseibacillus zhaodongensis TaxID=2668065 RepID=UPI001E49F98D|nr:GNAT family N-acetyltransferase [Lacticaseibacillus zhaodongensis]